MCGIVGIIHPSSKGPVDPGLLRQMNSTLKHRGPDDEGCWVHRNVGLAMRRLSIIDLEGGHQPISNEEGNIWTVFNGEIYNFQELQKELLAKGHRFRTRSDTEVIVHLYEEEGEDFVRRLRGMFAIALWDDRQQILFLYRDRVGIKPLHYWSRNGTLLFASEIKALLEYPEVGRELSLSSLSDYLSFLYIPTPKTIYQEISKLPAGHYLRYAGGKIRILPYWDFRYREEKEVREQVWTERLTEALSDAVKSHMVADVPLGAFLSGGADSSTVVSWMSRWSSAPVKTYSIGFRDDRFNELPYARQVARRFGTNHHETVVECDAFQLLPKILNGFDEPFADSSAIPTFLVSEFARREVKVALSGDGGDELFAGYLWTRKEMWLEKYRSLPNSFRKSLERLFLKGDYRPLREAGLVNLMQRFFYDANLSPEESYARRSSSFQPWMKDDLFQDWVRDELRGEESIRTVRSLSSGRPGESVMEKFLYFDSKLYLPDDLLAKVDRMSMLHSLEVRIPLLDHQLIELVGSIPFSLKLKGRTTKYILKRAMKNFLPAGILRQRKQGFSVPLQRWFRHDLFDFARKLLLEEKSLSRRFFRREYVEWILAEHRSGRQRFGTQLYALVIFELWCRLTESARGRVNAEAVSLKDLAG